MLNAERFFFSPLSLHVERLTGLGLASIGQPLASEEDSEKNNTTNHQSEKRRGNRGHRLCSFVALFCQVARLSTFVAVGLTGFSAVHGDMTKLSTPVTFHLVTKLLDVAKAAAGVALLLIGIAITGHVTGLATGVAELLPLLFGLSTFTRNVASPVAVVARILWLVTVPGQVPWVSAPIAVQVLASPPASPTSS